MNKSIIFGTIFAITFFITSCVSIGGSPKKKSLIDIKEGVLPLKTININLDKQMPLIEKVGKNEVKISSVTVFESKDGKALVVELEFVFVSFEIPEGLPSIARTVAYLNYNTKSREFRLARISNPEIKFLKEDLIEYISPQQRKIIKDAIISKLYSLILHKSKRELNPIKSFIIKEGKIKIIFQ